MNTSFSNKVVSCSFFSSAPTSGGTATLLSGLCSASGGMSSATSTSELIDWLKLLMAEDIPLAALQSQDDKVSVPPLVGALLKNEQDITLFEKLVFMNQRNR